MCITLKTISLSKSQESFIKNLKDVNESFKYVKYCYKIMCGIYKDFKEKPGVDPSIYERNYIIILAYYWGRYLNEEQELCNDCDNVLVNGELYKAFKFSKIIEKIERIKNIPKGIIIDDHTMFVPDFLIHKNYDSKETSYANQKVVVEAKVKKFYQNDFNRDFFKLNIYLEYLEFQNAVYLIINTKKEKVDIFVKDYANKNKYFLFKKQGNKNQHLFFFIQESKNSEPKMYEFDIEKKTLIEPLTISNH